MKNYVYSKSVSNVKNIYDIPKYEIIFKNYGKYTIFSKIHYYFTYQNHFTEQNNL